MKRGWDRRALLRALRPLQWTKNTVVLAALVFSGGLFDAEPLARAAAAALVFCCVSSVVYLVNDLRDVAGDRLHPTKRLRPIAAGTVTRGQARTAALGLLTVVAASPWLVRPSFLAVVAGYLGLLTVVAASPWLVRPSFLAVVAGYLVLMVGYSYGLKRLVILDVFAIAVGFVLRAAGGAVAIDVPISPWLYLCTMFLALFIGFGKRRHELGSLEGAAARHRANLEAYSVPLLDQLIGVVASATVMAYAFYTFDAPNVPRNHAMMLTIPFVVYAIFRYLYLVHRRDLGGAPELLLFADPPLLVCIAGWGLSSVAILYFVS